MELVSINQKYIVARGRMILSAKYRKCKDDIALQCKTTPYKDKVAVGITIETYKDIDAVLKIILDGCEDKAYINDRDITELHVWKTPAKRGSLDKVRVSVESINNRTQL